MTDIMSSSARGAAIAVLCLAAIAAHGDRRRAARPPLRITIEPTSGPIGGGTKVEIRGAGFSPTSRVTFDDVAASEVEFVDSTRLRLTTPPHPNGFAPVSITTGSVTRYVEFFYRPPPLDTLPARSITTVAGIGKYLAEGRAAREAQVEPSDITLDSQGTIYVAEPNLGVIRRISPDGEITRVAGVGADFAGDDLGDGRSARRATLVFPISAAFGPDESLYVADTFNHRVRRIDAATGIITTVAGSGPNGTCCVVDNFGGDGGPALQAKLNGPNQIAFDARGAMYILDAFNYRIRRVTLDGIITTIAGTGSPGHSGDGGPATAAQINIGPNADLGTLKMDAEDNLYLADVENGRIRKIDGRTGIITTIAGGGTRLEDGIPATEARLGSRGIAIDREGNLYASDTSRIRRIQPDGVITTFYGTRESGFSADGTAPSEGRLTSVDRMTIDVAGNLLFVEFGSARLRRIDRQTRSLTTIAGIGPRDFGEDGPAVAAFLSIGSQLAMTQDDRLLIGGGRLRMLDPAGLLRTIAGGGIVPNGPPPSPRPAIGTPVGVNGIAVDKSGTIWITAFRELAKITPDGIYTSMCCSDYGYGGDGGPVQEAKIDNSSGLALDSRGNLYIADTYNHRIRRVDSASGTITTIAGTAPPHPPNVILPNPSSGDGGDATKATLSAPNHIAIDRNDRLYIADTGGTRRVDEFGRIETVLPGCAGPMTSDSAGRIIVYCGRIMRIEPSGAATLLGTIGHGGFSGDGGPVEQAGAGYVSGIAADRAGNLYLFDAENRRVRAIRAIVPD